MFKNKGLLIWLLLCIATITNAANDKFTLVIDAGHGGNDAGALGKYSKEKNINLNVALAFGRYVERNCPDVRVIYTRKTDIFIPLHQRANIANKSKADLFISIHTNALPKGRIARGLETYTLGMHRASDNLDVAKRENSVILVEKDYKQHYEGFDPNSSESYIMFEFMQDKNMKQSVELAKYVQKKTCSLAYRPDKGVKQAGFLVLRETSMPSCLIELGFITTPDEENYLNSSNGIETLARGIYNAFIDYKNKYDKNKKVTYKNVSAPVERNVAETLKADVKQTKSEVSATPDESTEKKVRKSSKSMMQELADAREGVKAEPTKSETVPVAARQHQENNNLQDNSAQQEPEQVIPVTVPETDESKPVFKVQILASSSKLNTNDAKFQGLDGVDLYQENGMYKYTVGSSENYNDIYKLRKEVTVKFPEAFIIAFKNGQKVNVAEAIREFKSNRNKK